MNSRELNAITESWSVLSRVVHVPETDAEYDQLRLFYEELESIVGEEEEHPLIGLLDVVGSLIESYDSGRVPNF